MSAPPNTGGAGRLIAFEGVDGCGKSTQARLLAAATGAVLTFEPGDTPIGAVLRRLVLAADGRPPVPKAEALLMVADRAQHVVEVIEPALRAGRWVVTDRYAGSTLAYQGWGRGLDLEVLRVVSRWASDDVVPDLTILLDVPAAEAGRRLAATAPDRLERLGDGYVTRVRDGFADQAAADPDGWVSVDGTATKEVVAEAVLHVVLDRLGPSPALPDEPGA